MGRPKSDPSAPKASYKAKYGTTLANKRAAAAYAREAKRLKYRSRRERHAQCANPRRAKFIQLLIKNRLSPHPRPESQIAIEAGYSQSMAKHRLKELVSSPTVKAALAAHGLDEDSIALHVIDLVNAKKSIYHQGEPVTDDVIDWESRRAGLDMVMKVRGDYAPTKHEVDARVILPDIDLQDVSTELRSALDELADDAAVLGEMADSEE